MEGVFDVNIVKFENSIYCNIVESVKELKNEYGCVVKLTISYVNQSINCDFIKPVGATAYLFGIRRHTNDDQYYTFVEGQVVKQRMTYATKENVQTVITSVKQFLEINSKQYELLLFLDEYGNFGISIVDYFTPENWNKYENI